MKVLGLAFKASQALKGSMISLEEQSRVRAKVRVKVKAKGNHLATYSRSLKNSSEGKLVKEEVGQRKQHKQLKEEISW